MPLLILDIRMAAIFRLSRFLQYAISKNWVDLEKLGVGENYYSIDEHYEMLIDYILDYFEDDKE